MTTTTLKEKWSSNKLPLPWMMLTGGIAGSIAEVSEYTSRLPPFHSIQPKLECSCKDKKDKL